MAPTKRTTRASPTTTTTTTPVTNAQLKALIDQGVADALVARNADRSRNGNDSHNSGTSSRRIERTARECTYTDFLKCQSINFKGTKGFVGLTQWFERIETVFNISNYAVEKQDTYEIYGRLDDAQDDRLLISGQLNLLRRDRRSHARTTRLMEGEARAFREAWVQSMDASDTARSETQMVALQSQQRPARDPVHPDVPEEAGSSS
ncbi:hypothetical protein Tco_0598838 [Tanacetum coccineum]